MKKFFKLAILCLTVVLSMSFLVACGIPSNPAKTRKNLQKDGYTFNKTIQSAIAIGLDVIDIETEDVICATKVEDDDIDTVLLVYCTSKDQAQKVEEKVIEVLKKNYNGDNDELISGRDGKIIFFGTQDAVDDCE